MYIHNVYILRYMHIFSFLIQWVFIIRHMSRVFVVGLTDGIPKKSLTSQLFSWLNIQTALNDPFVLASLGILDILMLMCSISIFVYKDTFDGEFYIVSTFFSNTYRCTNILWYTDNLYIYNIYFLMRTSLFVFLSCLNREQHIYIPMVQTWNHTIRVSPFKRSEVMRSTPIWAPKIRATNLPLLATQPCQPSPFHRSTRLESLPMGLGWGQSVSFNLGWFWTMATFHLMNYAENSGGF